MHPHLPHRLPDPQYCLYTRHHVHFSLFWFLRCSELAISSKFDPATNPTISDLTILDSETISFLIKQSKTDQVKKGHFVYIFKSSFASPTLPSRSRVSPPQNSQNSTRRVLISRWTPARCSRPDNLTFPVFTCPTRESQSPVGRRRGAPGQTNALPSARTKKYRTPSNATYPAVLAILAFSPPPARFDHPAHKYQSHLRCRKSLPAGQPHLFLLRQRS